MRCFLGHMPVAWKHLRRRWMIVSIVALGLVAGPLPAAVKVVRIGVVSGASASRAKRNIDAFREGLQELGYVEGENLLLEYRHANEEPDQLPQLAADLVRRKVDVILATGTRAIAAAPVPPCRNICGQNIAGRQTSGPPGAAAGQV